MLDAELRIRRVEPARVSTNFQGPSTKEISNAKLQVPQHAHRTVGTPWYALLRLCTLRSEAVPKRTLRSLGTLWNALARLRTLRHRGGPRSKWRIVATAGSREKLASLPE